jgi:hypothetical protein
MVDRTLLACYLINQLNGVFSMPVVPDFDAAELLARIEQYGLQDQLVRLKQSVPCPLDDYYEHSVDLKHAWSVNNLAFQDCLFNIVNESATVPDDYMSEKSFKPFIAGCLPVFKTKNQINKLIKFGFKINQAIYVHETADPVIAQWHTIKSLLALADTELLALVDEYRDYNRDWFFNGGFYSTVVELNKPVMEKLISFIKEVVD